MLAVATADGHLTIGAETFRAGLGRGGVRAAKQEGDGATPLAALALRQVLYRSDRGAAPVCAVPVEPLSPQDGWCDDPANAAYNRRVRLPIQASAERLWRDDALYDIIGVLGWNDAPVRRGRGSAIFLHIARPDYAPTDGCIALAANDLRRVLALGLTEIMVRT
ncbi:L,D-transpeptidase family protein [Rhodopila sp.]|uniref:L,D-transpeptidase family protein n=1 Tax=Rhodopila sp. TaxID=2480087 RepID=UPI003D0EFECD